MTDPHGVIVEYLDRFTRQAIEHAAEHGLDPREVIAASPPMVLPDPGLTITPIGPVTTAAPCQVHNKHIPASHINERHHVWPKGEGGPDIPDNLVVVCATGHNNIHALIKLYKACRGAVPYSELRGYTTGERRYAKLGYERITRGAM